MADAPNILHLHSTFAAGGKELRCVQLINAFGTQARHAIVSADPDRMEAAKLISDDIAVDYPQDFPSLLGKPFPNRLERLAKAMQPYDLVLTYNWGAMDAVMAHRLFAKRLGLPPLVHHEDGFNEDEWGRLKPARNLYRRIALRKAAALIVPSAQLQRIARGIWKQPQDKLCRIGNGIDIEAFAATPRPDALGKPVKTDGDYWVGTLAGLRTVKRLDRLVRAFAKLPPEWKLVIVGEGPERDAIERQACQSGVAGRVILPGFRPNPATYVGLFDIFALSSDTEQFPISVAEAMAASKPVVAPAVGDVAAMVGRANTPYITAVGDEGALARSLNALAADPELRDRIGSANRAKAAADFDETAMIAAYCDLYWSAMGRAAPTYTPERPA